MSSSRQKHLNQSLMRIPRRAESSDRDTLAATYVNAGSFSAMLHSADHQILYGRRGTGKTHALHHLGDLVARAGDVPVYVDLRTIGSAGGMYADAGLSTSQRGTHLLVDTLEAIHEELLTIAVESAEEAQNGLLDALDALAEAATAVQVIGNVEQESKTGSSASSSTGIELSHRPRLFTGSQETTATENRTRRTGVEQHHVVFGPLSRALTKLVRALRPGRLWLLLDEWSSVPLDLQPLLADLLRRSVLPTGGVTVKIASIERRSRFSRPTRNGDHLGIEVGADAAVAVSLDDSMLFDRTRTRAQDFFSALFFAHAGPRLSLMLRDPPRDSEQFVDEAFHRNAFGELVRAAEGIPRDAINIAALAGQHAHDQPIGVAHVRQAARDWYLRDKQTAISGNTAARRTLRLLIDEVVGKRHSRTFLLEQQTNLASEVINDLYDARLLHVLRRGAADRHRPGTLYDGFAIDYGCYVGLMVDGGVRTRPRDRIGWLSSARGVPPDDFNTAAEAIDLSALG
jgi:hypothetical protein